MWLDVDGTTREVRSVRVDMGRPAFGQDDSTIGLFKLDPDGSLAGRVKVRLSRGSATKAVIEEGLRPGDRVILSDTSTFDSHDRIQLR